MKIKCPRCSFENIKSSEFCQECGYKLSLENLKKAEAGIATSLHEEIEKIDDVIFKPKKGKSLFKKIILWTLIIRGVGFVGLMVLGSLPSDESSTTEEQTEPATFPVSYLNITDYDVIYDDYGESYFVGILKNAYSKVARNVKVRLDFYYDEALKRHLDTRNVVIESGAEPNGAFSFEKPLYFYSADQYWWIWKIESADYGL